MSKAAKKKPAPKPALTVVESHVMPAELVECEDLIRSKLGAFVDVGNALKKIQDGALYKPAGFKTFEAYCKERWDFSRARAYQLLAAASVVENVNHGRQSLPAPATEREARELAKLPPKDQPKAWAEAVKLAPEGKPTAKIVAEVVKKRLPPKEPKAEPEPKSEPHHRDTVEAWACPRCGTEYPKGVYPERSQLCGQCADTKTKPSKPAPSKWQCDACDTWWPDTVTECRECEAVETENETPPFNASFEASNLYDAAVEILHRWPAGESYQALLDVLGQLRKKIEKLESQR